MSIILGINTFYIRHNNQDNLQWFVQTEKCWNESKSKRGPSNNKNGKPEWKAECGDCTLRAFWER